MKYITTILFCYFYVFGWSQVWDTIYSNDSEVEIAVEISYFNCNFVNIDTIYRLNSYTTDSPNRRLFHHKTNSLIFERCESNDTTYCYGYYHSGKIKVIDISSEDNWIHHSTYYENGQLCSGGDLFKNKFFTWNRYYPDGKIMSTTLHYDYLPGRFGNYEEYYPNGKVSCIEQYSLPDTSVRYYQSSEIIKGEYFDFNGNRIDSTKSVINEIRTWIQPSPKTEGIKKIDTLYSHYAVSNLTGYNDNLAELRSRIKNEIKITSKCDCKNGIAWIDFIVNKKGEIQNISVDYPDDCIKKEIIKALEKIGGWKKGYIENKEVDVYVHTYFVIK